MATTKERILVTLTPSTARTLRARALQERTPRATIAARIIENGLDNRRIWLSEKEADALFRKLHTVQDMLSYTIRYHRLVIERDLRTIDVSVWESICDTAHEKLSRYPEQFGKPLRNVLRGLRVLRVSDWRIVFRIEEDEVLIGAVRHRRDGYKDIRTRFI